jgi:hypothetical protein
MLRRGMYQAGILVVNGCGKVNGREAAPYFARARWKATMWKRVCGPE